MVCEKKPRDWKLVSKILASSVADDWVEAKDEWAVMDYYESSCGESCLCGKENITNCHTIKNVATGEELGPIGSSCIEKFESSTMNEDVSLSKTFVKLNNAFNDYVNIDDIRTLLRNKKLLTYLSDKHVFDNDNMNEFYGKMVRKRTHGTDKQEQYLKQLVFYKVKPYIQNIVKDYHSTIDESRSNLLVDQSESVKFNMMALHAEFDKPSTTLKALYPYLSSSDTLDYLHSQSVFKDTTNEYFFNTMITNNKPPSDKQRVWFKNIISQQIKPFVIEQVNNLPNDLDLDDLCDSQCL